MSYHANSSLANAVLHEMMHAGVVTWLVNKRRKIKDIEFWINGSDQLVRVYGPGHTKLLAAHQIFSNAQRQEPG
jgi:hypothetical protein